MVSKMGMINMPIANAGADANGNAPSLLLAKAMNFTAIIALTTPINKDPVSPINMLAGEKLKNKKASKLPANEKPIIA